MDQHNRPPARNELEVGGTAPATALEGGVGEVRVVGNVVGLVPEPERPRVGFLPALRGRKARDRLVPAGEGVVVVKPEPVAPGRAVRGGADDIDAGLSQPRQLPLCIRADVDAVDAFEGDEIVVKPDLVAELLQPAERVEQARLAPVRRRVQNEVRGPQPPLVLEPRERERAVEPGVDVVAQREIAGALRKLPQRNHVAVAETLEEARELAIREAALRDREEQTAPKRFLHEANVTIASWPRRAGRTRPQGRRGEGSCRFSCSLRPRWSCCSRSATTRDPISRSSRRWRTGRRGSTGTATTPATRAITGGISTRTRRLASRSRRCRRTRHCA